MKARPGFQYFAAFILCCSLTTFLSRPMAAQSAPQTSSSFTSSTLAVHIVGLRNATGNVRVKLMRDSNPVDSRVLQIDTKNLTADVVFDKLPQGVYSVSLIHDENMNGKLDTNLFGMPVEGYGFSNNPKKRTGKPGFDETNFQLNQPDVAIEIKMIYW